MKPYAIALILVLAAWSHRAEAQEALIRHRLNFDQFQRTYEEAERDGFRLIEVSGYSILNEPYYAAIWERRESRPIQVHHRMTTLDFQRYVEELAHDGYRPVQFSAYTVANEPLFAAIWERRDGFPLEVHHQMTSVEFQRRSEDLARVGFRLTHLSPYTVGNEPMYAAMWERTDGPPLEAEHRLTSTEFQRRFDDLSRAGFRLLQVNGYSIGNVPHYAAIWERRDGRPLEVHHGLTSDQYQVTVERATSLGFRVTHLSGFTVANEDWYAVILER